MAESEDGVVSDSQSGREGLFYGLAAYGLWGLVPLYFKALGSVSPGEVLAQRIVWSVVFLALLLTLTSRWSEGRRCFRSRSTRVRLAATALLVGLNWLIYIYSVYSAQLLQSSLGYFITPLVNVLLGMVFLGERLRPAQWAAVGLALAGVVYLVVRSGQFPWIALTLASSFGMYGLLRKQVAADGVIALAVETTFLFPFALSYLVLLALVGDSSLGTVSRRLDALLLASGVVTTVPLICFGQAARRLRLATLGFLQYLSPTIQFLLAVLLFGETFSEAHLIGFGCIWLALALYSLDSVHSARAERIAREDAAAALPSSAPERVV